MSLGKPGRKESVLQKTGTESETVGGKQRCAKVVVPTGNRAAAGPPTCPPRARAASGPGARRARDEAVEAAARTASEAPPRSPRSAGVRKHFPGARRARRRDPASGGAHARRGGPQGTKGQRRSEGAPPAAPSAPQARRLARRGGGTCGPEIKSQARPRPKQKLPAGTSPARATDEQFRLPFLLARPGSGPARPALTRLSRRLSGTGILCLGGSMDRRACAPGRQPCWCGAEVASPLPARPASERVTSARSTLVRVERCHSPGSQKHDAESLGASAGREEYD